MTDRPDLPWDGGCRCGRIRFRISAPPLMETICHCTGCQRMTASAFSTTLITPAEAFAVTAGEPVQGGLGTSKDATHHHCPHCKSWVFTRVTALPIVNIRATMLDNARWFVPFMETYTSEALPWAVTHAPHSYAKFPADADYQALMEDYRAARWASATEPH